MATTATLPRLQLPAENQLPPQSRFQIPTDSARVTAKARNTSAEQLISAAILKELTIETLPLGELEDFTLVLTAYSEDTHTLKAAYSLLEQHLARLLRLLIRPAANGPQRIRKKATSVAVQERIEELCSGFKPEPFWPAPLGIDEMMPIVALHAGDQLAATRCLHQGVRTTLRNLAEHLAESSTRLHSYLAENNLGGTVTWPLAGMCKAEIQAEELSVEEVFSNLVTTNQPATEHIHLLNAKRYPLEQATTLAPAEVADVMWRIPSWLRPAYSVIDGTKILHRMVRDTSAAVTTLQPIPVRDPLLVFDDKIAVAYWDSTPETS